MAAAGPRWAGEISTASSRAASAAEREGARALVARATTTEGTGTIERLRAVGVLALRAALLEEGWRSVARVAGKLPVALGRRLLG
jgi:hypothetical protein